MSTQLTRLEEIAGEVIDLINASNVSGFFDDNTGNMRGVENRLQEIMQSRQTFESIEIAVYLRTCSSRQIHLPTWQPLLNAAIEMATWRGERVDNIFYGLMEPRSDPSRNTGFPK